MVSIPLGFFLGWLGTVTSKECDAAKWAELEVRSLTGAGAEKAVVHQGRAAPARRLEVQDGAGPAPT